MNEAIISGKIIGKMEFSHEMFGEKFYVFKVETPRSSGVMDVIKVMISEILMSEMPPNDMVSITGQFRSHNENGKLLLYLFVREVADYVEALNQITLKGVICKPPTFRTTPGGREIADVLVAVGRTYGRSDYIPCICWGRQARAIKGKQVGDTIELVGRMQSRDYQKGGEIKTAYEISVNELR